ncbi:Triosephosphate isomerase [Nosema bombycis CQ1]|jgi:triosephosphate isomerase|uniref:Triosephosphate isomerase n=1 Tax=Nosema bombycis (strain CQ1 / CVCC 102059) TaxID=578461 RepID=R0MHR1_NOSB1|nr:Triosephosphate isomerase [Nosema bombycis CQ1]|eukprot:EOB13685.1 Triosephosphate isomerase [Nosema bombycis CQ1]
MKPFVVANWKANESLEVLENLEFNKELMEVAIAPPNIYIDDVRNKVESHIKIASQDSSKFGEGPFTGETPARLLKKKGVDYVIIGHSERRLHFNENTEILSIKVRQVIQAGMRVILCIGESDSDINEEDRLKMLYTQFFSAVGKNIEIDIAYEPVWSIGTGVTPDPKKICETIKTIRDWCKGINVTGRILYGGSVSSQNVDKFIDVEGCDGFLLGNKSLTSDFHEILKKIEAYILQKK